MSKSRAKFVVTVTALFWFALSAVYSTDAQVTVQFRTQGYYGNQPVYRGNNVTSPRYYCQPNYGDAPPYSSYLWESLVSRSDSAPGIVATVRSSDTETLTRVTPIGRSMATDSLSAVVDGSVLSVFNVRGEAHLQRFRADSLTYITSGALARERSSI